MNGIAIMSMDAQPPAIDLGRDLTGGWIGHYLRRKARQVCRLPEFSASDRLDIEQELRLALCAAARRYAPERGSWRGYAASVIDRSVARLIRHRRRLRRQWSRDVVSLSISAEGPDGGLAELGAIVTPAHQSRISGRAVRDHADDACLSVDVSEILAVLPQRLVALAHLLRTYTITEVSRMCGIPRRTLRDRVCEIRDCIRRHRRSMMTKENE